MQSSKQLFVWYHSYLGVILDKPQIPADDVDKLLHLSDVVLSELFERGVPIHPEEWEGVVVWVERYHPRVPVQRHDIPPAFRSSLSSRVHFHSPRVRALLKRFAGLIQYLPTPLLDGCTGQRIGVYYAANFLIQYGPEAQLEGGRWQHEYRLNQRIEKYPISLVTSGWHVVVDQEVRNLLLKARVIDEGDFTPLRLSEGIE
jgi:hypothetical protein